MSKWISLVFPLTPFIHMYVKNVLLQINDQHIYIMYRPCIPADFVSFFLFPRDLYIFLPFLLVLLLKMLLMLMWLLLMITLPLWHLICCCCCSSFSLLFATPLFCLFRRYPHPPQVNVYCVNHITLFTLNMFSS